MSVLAAVMTGQGVGAIATIQLLGDSVEAVLRGIFRRANGRPFEIATGLVLVGEIVDGGEPIDQVTIGCEDDRTIAIHCHGNPLIEERIMSLLRRHGAEPVQARQLLARMLSNRGTDNTIGIEARLALAAVKTIEGATLIANQVRAGLTEAVTRWRDHLERMPLERIATEAERILRDSDTARLILWGCTIALIGPPNTGKSTLLNALAGREKAIVTDIRGTTRDWVSAEIHIPPLAATLIDTAGIDPTLPDGIDKAAQDKSMQVLEQADVVLLVLDATQPAGQLDREFAARFRGKRVLTVLNKSDLSGAPRPESLPDDHHGGVPISAKHGTGIDGLIQAVHQICGLPEFDWLAPIAFTERQRKGLEQLRAVTSVSEAAGIIGELMHGPLVV